jgi:hypothetical protein
MRWDSSNRSGMKQACEFNIRDVSKCWEFFSILQVEFLLCFREVVCEESTSILFWKYSCESSQRIPESTDVKQFNFEKVSWLSFNMKGRGYLDKELRSTPLSIHAMGYRCYELGFLSLLCIRCERLNQESQFRQLGYQNDIDYAGERVVESEFWNIHYCSRFFYAHYLLCLILNI